MQILNQSKHGLRTQFDIAISYSDADREFVHQVATEIKKRLPGYRIFLDTWYESSIVGCEGDKKFESVFAECGLAVPFFSHHYVTRCNEHGSWCQIEWRTIRKRRNDDAIVPVKLDTSVPNGWESTDITINKDGQSAEQVANTVVTAYLIRRWPLTPSLCSKYKSLSRNSIGTNSILNSFAHEQKMTTREFVSAFLMSPINHASESLRKSFAMAWAMLLFPVRKSLKEPAHNSTQNIFTGAAVLGGVLLIIVTGLRTELDAIFNSPTLDTDIDYPAGICALDKKEPLGRYAFTPTLTMAEENTPTVAGKSGSAFDDREKFKTDSVTDEQVFDKTTDRESTLPTRDLTRAWIWRGHIRTRG